MHVDALLGGLGAEAFLADYWQRRPLIVRQAVPDFENPIDAEELAGLACEPGVRSRLVTGHPERRDWSVEYGPFDPERFAALPGSAWTLLVSQIEHYWPEASGWLERFDFIPRWRRDDLMISYAVRDGSVGPHIDAYDVFLFQAQGRRRWQIQEPPPESPICLPALPLAILRSFDATSEWVLEPGDMLYLPPGIPHLGMALDDDCMTWSIGFRAPAWRDLVGAFLEDRLHAVGPDRFADAGRSPSTHAYELSEGDRSALRNGLLARLELQPAALDRFFGAFLTRPEPQDEDGDAEDASAPPSQPPRLDPQVVYRIDPDLHRFWMRDPDGITVFFAGHALVAPGLQPREAEQFCVAETILPADWLARLPELGRLLETLLAEARLEPAADSGS
jgi:50S ribosomal protein L16 3-hydroxylase